MLKYAVFIIYGKNMKQINPKAASIEALKEAIGQNLRTLIKDKIEIQAFCENNDISSSTLYRLLEGKNVSTDNFFRVLRGLELWGIFDALLEPPRPRPVDVWNITARARDSTARKVMESSPVAAGVRGKLTPYPRSMSPIRKHLATPSGTPAQQKDENSDG